MSKKLFAPLFAWLFASSLILAPVSNAQDAVDREYMLEASILGYRGIGGAIDGIRNPLLQAAKGETVRITIVNGENLTHDIALEKQADVKSAVLAEAGATASITFVAQESDVYFCTVPGHRAAGMEGRIQLLEEAGPSVAGLPVVKNGRALNLGFEDGTYKDWTVEGNAFGDGPVEGDVIFFRTGEGHSGHAGKYWASSGEVNGHRATGTMTSETFTVTQPYASFLVAGGALGGLHVQLVKADNGEVFFEISGYDNAALRPVVVDLAEVQGQDIFIRIVDEETGTSEIPYIRDNQLAYISFDDFQFYPSRPNFVNEYDPSEVYIMPPILEIPHAGLSGEEAAKAMELPEGFTVTLAAAEPDVVRPIAFTYDDRGRLWVVEAHTYPVPAPEGEGKDRILIFEDTNGDGKLDSRKIFTEGLNLVSGMELGYGGVFVGAAPYLLYIPIEEGEDRPAGPPQILLDGWGTHDTHETLNSLRWGPDGWLYGAHGVFTHSNVGKPGASDEERVRLNGGVWRYHPAREAFELFAEGSSNPWGLDFNEYGHPFITACVIPHLYYLVPGGRYQRQAGQHFNPYVYDDIKTHADHVHWVGDHGPHAGNHRSDAAGGGHAHAGAMIYLGGSWPEQYRNQLFMNNIHGFRTNMDILERRGSGYVGKHGEDFLFAHDSWSQMLNLKYGPDGSVYVIDWYDKNQCHSPNPDVHDKTLGRIFKITHENDQWVQVDLQQMSNSELVRLQLHENEWYVRHARRILSERGADRRVHRDLRRILESGNVVHRLRALWALYMTDGMAEEDLIPLLDDGSEYMRSWAVQLIADDKQVSAVALKKFATMAREDESPMVRLYLASALQRVPAASRWETLAGLYTHAEDAEDHDLPLMVWYAAEPTVPENMDRAMDMALAAELPNLLSYTVQRVAAVGTPDALSTLARHLEKTTDPEQQRTILKGLNELVGSTE